MDPKTIFVTKANGNREPFDVNKLEYSLKHAGANSVAIGEILKHISAHLKQDITTHDIYKHAFELLHKYEHPAALKYSLKRAILDLGPSGFPFEDYVAEIFRKRGFEAKSGQIVKGFCVEHEIDVVAWNDEKLIMVEAKFHNELGVKSDLKVVLYVKARFDDLAKVTFNYGKERSLNEAWLVTNTKFTTTAIEYGMCQGGLVMVGWNYPPKGNLHDIILEQRLHPLTCLVHLSGHEKRALLEQGIVLCQTLVDNPDLLEAVGVSKDDQKKVLDEIEGL